MRECDLCFAVNDRLKIRNQYYIVTGMMNFLNEADGCNWTEYKLVEASTRSRVSWLSIDMVYHEYAIYKECDPQIEDSIQAKGYHKVDEGIAKVMDFRGDVDTEYAEVVRFVEYEDSTEEKIIAVEEWQEEHEYSTGNYLEAYEIELVSESYNGTVTNIKTQRRSGWITGIIIVIMSMWIGIPLLSNIWTSSSSGNLVQKIKSDSQFTYVTSITAELDNTQKADVYETTLSVEEAAKVMLNMAGSSVQSVDECVEDGTVAIVTKRDYCLVYQSEDTQTLVQVSTRQYTYSSRQQPYRSYSSTYDYYRSYYYTTSYLSDHERYKGDDAFQDYSGKTVTTDSNNRYKTYSDSIKQSSVGSRTSSGGGTSSGK